MRDSLKGSPHLLKHPENVIHNSLEIVKPNEKIVVQDINSTFKVVTRKKSNDPTRSPGLQKVRFKDLPNMSSEETLKRNKTPPKPEKEDKPKSGIDFLHQLRENERKKGKLEFINLLCTYFECCNT